MTEEPGKIQPFEMFLYTLESLRFGNNLAQKCDFGVAKQMAWQMKWTSFCKLCSKARGRPAVKLFVLHFQGNTEL